MIDHDALRTLSIVLLSLLFLHEPHKSSGPHEHLLIRNDSTVRERTVLWDRRALTGVPAPVPLQHAP